MSTIADDIKADDTVYLLDKEKGILIVGVVRGVYLMPGSTFSCGKQLRLQIYTEADTATMKITLAAAKFVEVPTQAAPINWVQSESDEYVVYSRLEDAVEDFMWAAERRAAQLRVATSMIRCPGDCC